MAKIDFDQLDDFDLTGIQDGDILIYNAATFNLEPGQQAAEVIVFRRAMLLMGG